ncbi:hypothetical protein [Staphylococcus sp. HMSC034G07]|uniref:hypothetical protein n=1 Tax=Staphylococcus sp. HMSC034G07 TaxID=1715065 RepID=UPI00114CB38F|nr:hypothetical protein [Staphylococcus sp. HMSC034G07]
MKNLSVMDRKKEFKIAHDYFRKALIEIDNKDDFDSNIKELLNYLNSYNFSIKDVLELYKLSDLQDEFDILRLMEYFHVSDKSKEEDILAHNEYGYLVIINDEDEI